MDSFVGIVLLISMKPMLKSPYKPTLTLLMNASILHSFIDKSISAVFILNLYAFILLISTILGVE